ncbi:formin-binding protein [Diaporthe australafricana]|uniref:Formin-binding protein n=1 Tax=Diaporthe australafricana TaxID=127596 RepID=A0ABR3VXE7_9PEZI
MSTFTIEANVDRTHAVANNFWGKEDAGVPPMLERMHGAKQTCDELRSFYSTRASIEDEYSRKLLALCRKSLGSQEMGSLKTSLDTVRGEVEGMAKQHQNNAAQMRSELEEPLAAFAGGMKERRKIVQNTIEKLLKVKQQQTALVNKVRNSPTILPPRFHLSRANANAIQTRDRYEQECLKIKGYLAQGHMVMGQEERKNKAKLEKTQISLATSNAEYEAAVKALEETTARWNREWKAAADKFQDLEEERLDFTKSSLWTFANIASTVCVSDDASCEKVRLSLEKMEVEKDIITFIRERGTGQEIPDPPKYINFCRGDVETPTEESEDEAYSVAQFPRSINPAFRSSSPQPSTYESHHDPTNALAKELGHDFAAPGSRDRTITPQRLPPQSSEARSSRDMPRDMQRPMPPEVSASSVRTRKMSYDSYGSQKPNEAQFDPNEFAPVPHDPYPMDGMTMLCRPNGSDLGSQLSGTSGSERPTSRDEHSDYSAPTSYSSRDPMSGKTSPVKQDAVIPPASPASGGDRKVMKKRSGFFQNHSPFSRRKSTRDAREVPTNNRNTWHVGNGRTSSDRDIPRNLLPDRAVASPDPIDANADVAINIGENVLPVKLPGRQKPAPEPEAQDDDPIAQALAELKGVTLGKQSSVRMSADHYHGIATPAPGSQPFSRSVPPLAGNSAVASGMRGTPPPSYDQPVHRLGVPSPACTSKAMKQTSQKYTQQTRSLFSGDRPGSGGYRSPSRPPTRGSDMPRAASPAPPRSTSPLPGMNNRSASPNPYAASQRGSTNSRHGSVQMDARNSAQGYYRQNTPNDMPRAASPLPPRGTADYGRPASRAGSSYSAYPGGDMPRGMSPAPTDDSYAGSTRGRGGRPGTSQGNRAMGLYEPPGAMAPASRQRSKSVADGGRQYNQDGRMILHFARAMYMYQAAIPEELGFNKGDILAVLRHQDDGWWEAEVHGANGQSGLVPSNYLQTI